MGLEVSGSNSETLGFPGRSEVRRQITLLPRSLHRISLMIMFYPYTSVILEGREKASHVSRALAWSH